jgi:ribosomal protein S18 acetylase RimI-like enzyme
MRRTAGSIQVLRASAPAREETQILVAQAGGIPAGFAAFFDATVADDGIREAQVTALFISHAEAGHALMDACLARVQGVHRWLAFPAEHGRCPVPGYNAGWDGLSDHLSVAARVLAQSGFTPYYRELHMECAGTRFPLPVTPAPSGMTIVERSKAPGRFALAAQVEDHEVGICIYGTLAHVTDHPAARQWGYVMGLHVNESQRRRGIARHLLTRALRHLSDQGCDGCWLTTGADNWSAQPLYLALGFEIVDASACFRTELSGG